MSRSNGHASRRESHVRHFARICVSFDRFSKSNVSDDYPIGSTCRHLDRGRCPGVFIAVIRFARDLWSGAVQDPNLTGDLRWTAKILATGASNDDDERRLQIRDLRYEAGSPFTRREYRKSATPARFLGHTNLSSTSSYLNIHRRGLHDAMQKLEGHDPALHNRAQTGHRHISRCAKRAATSRPTLRRFSSQGWCERGIR